ncbi:unknown [Parabacteroides johnsonii CAG:246]|nr:unknown [Parabacteroides johnsonii CAG:246]
MSESVGAGFYSAQWKITSPYQIPMGRAEPCPYKYTMLINQTLYVPEIVLPPSPVQLV